MALNNINAGNEVKAAPLNENFEEIQGYQFGDGSDGDVTISSNTTLSEDKYYNNLTVESGVSLDTNGYRVYVKQKLINNGTIHNNGHAPTSDASNIYGGEGGGAGTLLGGTDGGDFRGEPDENHSGAGGGGGGIVLLVPRILENNGTISSNGGDATDAVGGGTHSSAHDGDGHNGGDLSLGKGAEGGTGGDADTYNGGLGGTISTVSDAQEKLYFVSALGYDFGENAQYAGGCGGGGGAYDYDSDSYGGAGGGGGGLVVILYRELTASGTIEAVGGSLGTGATGGTDGTDGANGKTVIAEKAA